MQFPKPEKKKKKRFRDDQRVSLTGGRCWATGRPDTVMHEIYFGSNRQKSIEWGMIVDLIPEYHNMTNRGVHFNPGFDAALKKWGQVQFMRLHPGEDFLKIFGWNYLESEGSYEQLQKDLEAAGIKMQSERIEESRVWNFESVESQGSEFCQTIRQEYSESKSNSRGATPGEEDWSIYQGD